MSKKLYIAFFSSFIVAMGYGIMIPVQRIYTETLGISDSQYGLILATFAFVQLATTPIFGKLSDSHGRTKFMSLSLLLIAFAYLIFFLAQGFWMLMLSRVISGVSAGMLLPSLSGYITDSTSPEHRSRAMMYSGAAFSLGIIFGPVVGGFVGEINYRLPFLLVSIVALLNWIITKLLVKDVRKYTNKDFKLEGVYKGLRLDIKKYWSTKIKKIFITSFIIGFGLYSFEPLLSSIGTDSFGAGPAALGMIFMILGISQVTYQVFIGKKLIDFIGEYKIFMLCLVSLGIGMILISFATSMATLYPSVPILAFSALATGSANSMLSKTDPENIGSLAGVNTFFMSMGGCLGPLICMTLYGAGQNLPFYLIFTLCTIAFMYLLLAKSKDTLAKG